MSGRIVRATLAAILGLPACSDAAAAPQDILIDDQDVYPESVTSTAAGAVINGSIKGVVFRALPGETVAKAWIRPTPENGLQAVFGVLADEKSATLWRCGGSGCAGIPSSRELFEIYRIRDGRIQKIEAVSVFQPYRMASPWGD